MHRVLDCRAVCPRAGCAFGAQAMDEATLRAAMADHFRTVHGQPELPPNALTRMYCRLGRSHGPSASASDSGGALIAGQEN